MKLASFADADGRTVPALVDGDRVRPLAVDSVVEYLRLRVDDPAEAEAVAERARASAGSALADVRLLAPVQPGTIRDFVAFEEHVDGIARSHATAVNGSFVAPEWYVQPAFYFTNPYAVVATGDEVAIPPGCAALDFELEVAAVIAQAGTNLTPDQGRAAIGGYVIMNDWSARDLQAVEMRVGLGPAKGKDFATTLGPWVVTADELGGYLDDDGFLALPMSVDVNGTQIGADLLSNMSWTFGELVAHASRGTWVRPGDVLGSGTCGNGGCLAELWGRAGAQLPAPLSAGDEVAMTVGGIGRISNVVVDGPTAGPVPAARRRPRTRP